MPVGLFLGATYAVFILKRFFSVVVMRYNRKGAVGKYRRVR